MKRWISTIAAVFALFGLSLVNAIAGEAEKEPLNLAEIGELALQEQADETALEPVEAGDMNPGAGIFILVVIAIGVAVAAN